MKLRNILILALAASVCTGIARSRKKQKPVPVVVEQPELKPVDSDKFSYAMGVYQASGLKNFLGQRENIDSTQYEDFVRGLNSTISPEEQKRQIAFVTGLRIAQQLREQMIPSFNTSAVGKADSDYTQEELLRQGITEGLLGKAVFSADSAQKVVDQQMAYQVEQMKKQNLKWLEDNKKNDPEVKTTASGLQYKVLTQGTGVCPVDTNEVEVNYEGKLIDGTEFDSSYKRGKTATFGVTKVIKGWTEGLKMMPVGSTYMLYIPYELAYGERGNRNIPPYSTLIFKVELVSIKK